MPELPGRRDVRGRGAAVVVEEMEPAVERRFLAGSAVEVAVLVGLVRDAIVDVVPAAVLVEVEAGRVALLTALAGRLAAAAVPVAEIDVRVLLGELVEEGATAEVRRAAEVVDLLVSSSEAEMLGRERWAVVVVAVPAGLLVVVVVDGRVGGLLNPPIERVDEVVEPVAGFEPATAGRRTPVVAVVVAAGFLTRVFSLDVGAGPSTSLSVAGGAGEEGSSLAEAEAGAGASSC